MNMKPSWLGGLLEEALNRQVWGQGLVVAMVVAVQILLVVAILVTILVAILRQLVRA